jgi:predicted transcriptional regulator YdeE
MKKIMLDKDIPVFCVTAKSFPDGILEAHQKLHSLVPISKERAYFGISRPEKGVIVYKAAAEEKNEGEAEKLGCEKFIIQRGKYIFLTIEDYAQDVQRIGNAFQKLISEPGIDPDGYCVEWYLNDKDIRCMIKLQSKTDLVNKPVLQN